MIIIFNINNYNTKELYDKLIFLVNLNNMNTYDLKNFVISDRNQKYEEINKKILKIAKIYFNIINNYSHKIILNESKDNKYNIFEELKIKQLLESQNNLIKELVKIINNILLESINSDVIKKCEGQSLEIQDESLYQKHIIINRNLNQLLKSNNNVNNHNSGKNNKKEKNYKYEINKKYMNNKTNINKIEDNNLISKKLLNQKEIIPLNIIAPKTDNEFNGTLSFFNISTNANNNINENNLKNYEKYSNSYRKTENSPIKTKHKSYPNSEINYYYNEVKDKGKVYSNLKKKIINNIFSYSNYTIDEERNDYSGVKERQALIACNKNIEDEYSFFPEILSFKKKRIKYRKIHDSPNRRDMNINIRNLKSFNLKNEYIFNSFGSSPRNKNENLSFKKRCNTSFNIFKFNLFNNKYNNYLPKFTRTKIYTLPYINNGKINTPSNLTKIILNTSYNKINKYNKKK